MGLDLPQQIPFSELRTKLQAIVNGLIVQDFEQLVNLLYRVDVNERKLKFLLRENVGEDAAVIIADLIIARQMEKIASRKQFGQDNNAAQNGTTGEEERW